MAGSSFFALFDDIATLLDDISVMSKVAVKKTASVLTDDLAASAEKVVELKADLQKRRDFPTLFPMFLSQNRDSPIVRMPLLGQYLFQAVDTSVRRQGGASTERAAVGEQALPTPGFDTVRSAIE